MALIVAGMWPQFAQRFHRVADGAHGFNARVDMRLARRTIDGDERFDQVFHDHRPLYSRDRQNMNVRRPILTKRRPPTRRVEKLNMAVTPLLWNVFHVKHFRAELLD
jgi:hypothetical protein